MTKLQGQSEQAIEATPASVWAILEDSSVLAQWVPVVERVSEHSEREVPGSVRRCEVAMGRRHGYIVERCVESVPERRLRHAVDDDSLGFTRMFRDYTFTLELEPRGDESTVVTCKTFYEPRGLPARLMNAMLMRRRFNGVRTEILRGLKELSERYEASQASQIRPTWRSSVPQQPPRTFSSGNRPRSAA
jgi:uncharacterized protein YndB with AHSA1/START domain